MLDEDWAERLKAMPVRKYVYMDKEQYYECRGACKPYEIEGYTTKQGQAVTLVVCCAYCHFEEIEICKGIEC